MKYNTNDPEIITVGIVDDHKAVTCAFARLLNDMPGIHCTLEAFSGEESLHLLESAEALPHIILMDVDMKGMNGIDTTRHIAALYPTIKIIAFTSKVDDRTILQMIGAGACSYVLKEVTPVQMEEAIREVHRKGKYHADLYHLYASDLQKYTKQIVEISFTEQEQQYLQLLCRGYPYAQIANTMNVSIRTIDYYYVCVSRKLNTKSQVIMALEALRMNIARLDEPKSHDHKSS